MLKEGVKSRVRAFGILKDTLRERKQFILCMVL